MAKKTYKDVTGSGYTTYHSNGSSSKTYKNVMDDGFTTYHSEGSSSKTYKNGMDNGFTTYHSEGSSSKTYKNAMDDGFITFHSDGSTSKSYRNLTNNGYSPYTHEQRPINTTTQSIGSAAEDLGGVLGAVLILGFTVLCSFIVLKHSAVVPILIILAAFIIASLLGKRIGNSNSFILVLPIIFYGLQRFMFLTWTRSIAYDFIVGIPGFLGGIVIEVFISIYLLIAKIEVYDEFGNSNGMALFFALYAGVMAPFSVICGRIALIGFYIYDLLMLFILSIVIIVRCIKRKTKKK